MYVAKAPPATAPTAAPISTPFFEVQRFNRVGVGLGPELCARHTPSRPLRTSSRACHSIALDNRAIETAAAGDGTGNGFARAIATPLARTTTSAPIPQPRLRITYVRGQRAHNVTVFVSPSFT
jgi:hypothetical protein